MFHNFFEPLTQFSCSECGVDIFLILEGVSTVKNSEMIMVTVSREGIANGLGLNGIGTGDRWPFSTNYNYLQIF